MAKDDFLYADRSIANLPEGFTETRLIAEGPAREAHEEAERHATEGLKKLTLNGGQGDGLSALVDGEVLTIKESLALVIARDIVKDAEARHKKPLAELTLMQLNEGLKDRVQGRATSVGAVMSELGRLQNQAIYQNRVRRR